MVAARPLHVGLDAHVVGRRRTGNETYVIGLGAALARRADIRVTAFADDGVAWPEAPPDRLRVVPLRWRSPYLRLTLELPVRARRALVDVLQVTYAGPPVAGVPVAVAIHDLSFEDVPGLLPGRMRLRLRTTVPLAARRAAVVLALSAFTRERLLRHYDLDPARVVVVPGGVDPGATRMDPDIARRRLGGLRLPARFVLHVGELVPRKNVPNLVAALARVRRRTAGDVGLVLAGSNGRGTAEVEAAVRRAGVDADAWVRHLGYVDAATLDALYGAAAVVAHPSRYEGFGLPILEAMARGAVVVTSSVTAMPEVAGDAALLTHPDDVEGLADALEVALDDEAVRARLRDAGPRRAARFTWDAAADAATAAYRGALAR